MAASRIRVLGRKAVRIGGFAGITAGMLPLYIARARMEGEDEQRALRDRWVGRWSGSLLRLFDVEVDYRGAPPPAHLGRLVVSNHRSALDIGILLRRFGGHMVSRADLARWPLVGAAARSVGTVFVDRSSRASGASTIRAVRSLLSHGETVLVFPEGTTFEGDVVRPFQAGAFAPVLATHARICPVGIAYAPNSGATFVGESFPQHLSRMAEGGRARVVVRIGPAVPFEEHESPATVAKRAENAVQALVGEARREVGW